MENKPQKIKVQLCPADMTLDDAIASSRELTENIKNPMLASMCFTIGYTIGDSKEYLASIINGKDVYKLKDGESICIFAPTGSGKTKAIEQIALNMSKGEKVIILTNRRPCKVQLTKDLCKSFDWKNIPDELIDKIKFNNNIEVMTYQDFVRHKHRYHGKKMILICDECHCFAEDSTFTVYPQQMLNFLHGNLYNTKRIYITATPDDVLPAIWNIESLPDAELYPLTKDNLREVILKNPAKSETRIRHIYLMKTNWDYLTFRTYHPANRDILIKYINDNCENGKKSLIFINDIDSGAELQEQLNGSQHIYSDDDKRSELHEIAINEKFSSDSLITTKVAENGLSLHDEKLSMIAAETYDITVLQQVIGRARVNRRNPREITVLIPDYSLSQLGSIKGKLYVQLSDFMKAAENPDFAMQYLPQPNPYIYYDAVLKRPVVNDTGIKTIKHQLDYITNIIEEENIYPHAFVRRILSIYDKDILNIESLSISYNVKTECIKRINEAWETYKISERNDEAVKTLKESLKAACNETKAYPKEFKSNIQLDTVNEILRFAGIHEKVYKSTVYDIMKDSPTSCETSN